ncbi:MAG: DUF5597 domain-containing protein [Bacteroides sp.]
MTRKTVKKILLTILLVLAFIRPATAQEITRVETVGGIPRLTYAGRPLLMLAGELHNSTSSTATSLDAALRTTRAMGLNTLIASVSWEQLEPEEGVFDYQCIDQLINLAGRHDMCIVLIWFGTWKNGESSYPPVWVKRDTRRFFRAQTADGKLTGTISPFCDAACRADARAFARLMARIREQDTRRLIQVVQVENEVGVFLDRDHCPAARKAARPGQDDERFMAEAYARYLQRVAEAGKKEHPLPMYANCWLPEGPVGSWPMGGPTHRVIEVYRRLAPALDWVSPDIYAADYREWCRRYHTDGNLFFIPETQREAGYAYYAFAEHDAQCFSPFAIEDVYNDPTFLGEYRVLNELLPVISRHQGQGAMHGFLRQQGDAPDDSTDFVLDDIRFRIRYIKGESRAYGLVIRTGKDEFLCAGRGAYITLESAHPTDTEKPCIGYAEEVERQGEQWITKVVLNGDQTNNHRMLYLRGRMPNADYREGGFDIPAPWTDVSHQRMYWPEWQQRFKVSGIYRIRTFRMRQ